MCMYIWEKLITKAQALNWALGIGIASSLSGMAFNWFWKRALIWFMLRFEPRRNKFNRIVSKETIIN